ncbi:MAG: hypothetical protein EOP49_35605 [Sphingobacteriales bacterium]|nr:MAG: hypothetical protein EOP49_35605 [Sphingobacteriales bacterium]
MAIKKWTSDTTIREPIRIEVTNQQDTTSKASYVFSKMETAKNIIVRHHHNSPNTGSEPVLLNPGPKLMQKNIAGMPKLKKPLLDYLYTQIVPVDSIVSRRGQDSVLLHFANFLHVTFTGEQEETAYLKKRFPFKQVKPGPQQSVLGLYAPAVSISADGNFADPYDLVTEQYWSYEKLDKLLPLDYKPE